MKFYCTEFSDMDNWSFGSRSFTYDYSIFPRELITIGTESGNWIVPFNSWNISTTFNLAPRSDTGQINSPPYAFSLPTLRLQSGCNHAIPMTVSDPDGDIVRCRWAVGDECKSICNAIPGATLNSVTCTITYNANSGTGYKAVAVMVEDFIPGSSKPLSSVAFQFLVLVVSSNKSCSDRPTFSFPTPSSGSLISISPGGTYTAQIRADSGPGTSYSTTEIQVAGPTGLKKGKLQPYDSVDDYYVSITWTPQINQIGITHPFCFVAINSLGISSVQSCVMLVPRCFISHPIPFANKLSVFLHNVSVSISFNATVHAFQKNGQVTFVHFNSDSAVHRTSLLSSEVTFDNSMQMTIRPKYMFTEGSIYYIKFAFSCYQSKLTNKTLWTFEVIGKVFAHTHIHSSIHCTLMHTYMYE